MGVRQPLRHVIFLGAGASVESGYPLAKGLRLRLADEGQMAADLGLRYNDDPKSFEIIKGCFSDFKESVDLFRYGGFGTVDEFGKLASQKYPKHVQAMKCLTQLALSLHNPEDTFHKSDYYLFIQRLFDEKELHSLKSHITLISYNYDSYLEYLLLRSQQRRNHLAGVGEPKDVVKNRLCSGFYKPDDAPSLVSLADPANQHFRHFKLHGAISYAFPHLHKQLFEDGIAERFKQFDTPEFKSSTPPIMFPWELFSDDGEFVKFPRFSKNQQGDAKLYNLYNVIWTGAREAVQKAQKISFVGMSMHHYLEAGLKHLFDGKHDSVQSVVANKGNEDFRALENRLHPESLCGRVSEVLRRVAPEMKCVKSSNAFDGIFREDERDKPPDYDITLRYSFAEFIEKEID